MPEHQHNHQHHHSAVERAENDGPPVEPYPFVYSKDPIDERRFLRPGEPYGPAYGHGPSSWVLWVLGVILALIIGGGLLSIILQAVAK